MASDSLSMIGKAVGVLVTLSTMVWAHGSWVSSVNVTLAETGKAMSSVSESVSKNADRIQTMEASLVRVEADVESVKADNARIEALTNELSKHVGDLREVSAELKALTRKMNRQGSRK